MSDIRANTISNAAGTGPIDLYKQSAAKAWASLSGSFSVADSFNVSSSADLGIANSQITYANSLTGWPAGSVGADASDQAPWFTVVDNIGPDNASAVTFNNNGGKQDGRSPYYIIHGDLA